MRTRPCRPLDGVDLDEDRVARTALPHERGDCRIACIAAIPVALAVDFNCLKHRRQAGGSEQHVGRDILVAEHTALASTYACGSNEQLDRRIRQPPKVDML